MAGGIRALIEGLQAGQMASAPIADYYKRKQDREQALQDQDTQLRNHLLLQAALNPDLAQSITQIQKGNTVDGQDSVKPLALTDEQASALAAGKAAPEEATLNMGGVALNPKALKAAKDEEEKKKFSQELELAKLRASFASPYQIVVDPISGAVNGVNKKTLEATPVTNAGAGSSFSNSPKMTIVDLVDPETGLKTKYQRDPKGALTPIGASDVPKGQAVVDPQTGAVSVVNTMLPKGLGAGQAQSINQLGGSDAKPFSLTPKPPQMNEGDKHFVDTLSTKNANKVSISNQLQESLNVLNDKSVDEKTKIKEGQRVLKVLNSSEGADAVGAEEAQRLGSLLEFQFANPKGLYDPTVKTFGRDLGGFTKQLSTAVGSISKSAEANQKQIDNVMKKYGAKESSSSSNLSGNETALSIRQHLQDGTITREQARKMLEALK